jgi:type II secretory pathway pseudopilin PulG
MTVATISVSPFSGMVVAAGKSVMTVPVGASSGTLSHAEAASMTQTENATKARPAKGLRRDCVSIWNRKDNTLMDLHGQDHRQAGDRGYAMAALLVTLAVMSVIMSVALPAWRHQAQREKEAELVFRGEQYARAVALFRAKNGNIFPPNVDVLVQNRFLRKKYKDPITNQDFDIIPVGGQGPGPDGRGGQPQGGRGGQPPGDLGASPGRGGLPTPPASPGGFPAQAGTPSAGQLAVGLMGVHSKSQETSIRIYKGQTRYDQWLFTFNAVNRPGGAGAASPGVQQPGGGRGVPGAPMGAPGRGGPRGGAPGRGTGAPGRGEPFVFPGRMGGPGGRGPG